MTWHIPLTETKIGQLLSTLMNAQKFASANFGIFDQPNPENDANRAAGKQDLLKFKVVYSMSHVPESVTAQDLIYCFVNNDTFNQTFEFDEFHRIVKSEADQIDSGYTSQAPASTKSSAPTLQQCLAAMSNVEYLSGADAYECINCKSKQNATKVSRIHRTPPILLFTLQRFKGGVKN